TCIRQRLFSVRFTQLAKVVTHCSQAQRFSKLVAVFRGGLGEEAPEFPPLTVKDAELDRDAGKRRDSADEGVVLRLGNVMRRSPHGIERPLIVFTRAVDCSHDLLIATD